jgi:hypothetical protein
MDTLQDAVIIIGMASVGLLWIFSVVGGLSTLWDTFGDHAETLIARIRR